MRTSALRAFTASMVTTASFVVAAGVGVAPSYAAVAPKAPMVMPAAIESMPAYQPQTFCDPVDKPGPVAFGALLTTTYPDTHVVSISRGCASESGTSEHKDGVSYLRTVSGTYHYAAATGAVADGECDSRNGTTWRSTAPGDTSASSGVLDLWAGGHRSWHPVRATGGGCNTATHTYTQQ